MNKNCETCKLFSYHGIRRDGWPSTIFGFCKIYKHSIPDNCNEYEFGEPAWFDKHGIEISLDERNSIPNRSL